MITRSCRLHTDGVRGDRCGGEHKVEPCEIHKACVFADCEWVLRFDLLVDLLSFGVGVAGVSVGVGFECGDGGVRLEDIWVGGFAIGPSAI